VQSRSFATCITATQPLPCLAQYSPAVALDATHSKSVQYYSFTLSVPRTIMRFLSTAFIIIGLLLTPAVAHGVVVSFTANGVTYAGEAQPDHPQNKDPSPMRYVTDNGPVTDLTSANLACGKLSVTNKGGDIDVPVDAGSATSIQWSPSWPHVAGPVITYLAACGGLCREVADPTQLQFFKIDQVAGLSGSSTEWAQKDIAYPNSKPFALTIPNNLKPGHYLMRHEIIGLHNAVNRGGAELFPQCIQIEVMGTGNLVPKPENLVRIQDLYKADDPGILVDIYWNFSIANYSFPGPPLAELVPESRSGKVKSVLPAKSSDASPSSVGKDRRATLVQNDANVGIDDLSSEPRSDDNTVLRFGRAMRYW
ncbi:glycosyl hydrolase family 61-domain-containing protein, partial [Earliella scabrosa]